MWRYLAGVASALLMTTAAIVAWKSTAGAEERALPTRPAMLAGESEPLPEPPSASQATREERRFARYDRDKNGVVGREEYLASRRKAFARLDLNGDGRLSFEEYGVKTIEKFAKADADRSVGLDASEFATTRVIRKAATSTKCPPVEAARSEGEGES